MSEGKSTYYKKENDGYSVWQDGQKVAEKLSLEEAGELLDELCYEEADVCSNFSPSLWR